MCHECGHEFAKNHLRSKENRKRLREDGEKQCGAPAVEIILGYCLSFEYRVTWSHRGILRLT